MLGGVGAILTLHHVRPRATTRSANVLEITPEFLETVIGELHRLASI